MVRRLLPACRAFVAMTDSVRLAFDTDGCVAHAEIGLVGGGIREYVCCGRDVVPMDTDVARRSWYSGTTLAPWPNRLAGGAWTADGVLYEGDCNDGGKHALHGLVYDAEFAVQQQSPTSVTLCYDLGDDAIYPFAVRITITYTIEKCGLVCEISATNRSDVRVPIALGAHPYFPYDPDTRLVTSAPQFAEVGADMIPTGNLLPSSSRGVIANGETVLGAVSLDNCFSGMTRDGSGRAETALQYRDGAVTVVWQDDQLDYLQMFTKPDFPWAAGSAGAIGIEPQSAPPNALNSGDGLRWLSPGDAFSVRWGIEVR